MHILKDNIINTYSYALLSLIMYVLLLLPVQLLTAFIGIYSDTIVIMTNIIVLP